MKQVHYVLGVGLALTFFIFFREIFFSNSNDRLHSLINSSWIDEDSSMILELKNDNGVLYFEENEYDIRFNILNDSIKIYFSEDESIIFFDAKIESCDNKKMVLIQSPDTIYFERY